MAPSKQKSEVFELDMLLALRAASGSPYLEFLRVPHLSAGLYVLAAGSVDAQAPHAEDELYLVISGKGQLRVGNVSRSVGLGSLCFVKAGEAHGFHSVLKALRLLVVFGPAEKRLPAVGSA
ncbi:MAG: cupin domain-containing protein [Myxococcaceae bacterium]